MLDDCDELHGVADAVQAGGASNTRSHVTICARRKAGVVRVDVSTSSYAADLTPDQARYLARKLYRCARVVERSHGS